MKAGEGTLPPRSFLAGKGQGECPPLPWAAPQHLEALELGQICPGVHEGICDPSISLQDKKLDKQYESLSLFHPSVSTIQLGP